MRLTTGNWFADVSIYMTLVPITTAILVARTWRPAAAMLFLLVCGFCTEIFGLQFGPGEHFTIAFFIYSFVESAIFHSVIQYKGRGVKIISLIRSTVVFSFPLLIFAYVGSNIPISGINISWLELFNMTYEVLIAFLAARELLRLIETSSELRSFSFFWLLLGIFFYCFCTFFLMGIALKYPAVQLWNFLHNPVNIIVYWIYAYGFWKDYKMKNVQRMSSL